MGDKITALQKEIGQRIMLCRGENESQQQLGDAIGVSREVIQHWERGSRQIKAEHLCKLAKHFGTSPDYLLGFTQALSADAKARAAEEYTGLSAAAAKRLRLDLVELKMLGGDGEIPNWFFSSNYFMRLMTATEKYRIYTKKAYIQDQPLTLDNNQYDPDYINQQAAKLEMMDVLTKMTNEIDKECDEERGKDNGKL